ncbi:gas vesicle protein GvpG [Sinomonas gamaensis]|jgi:cytochrome c-type biogenesis protein CcmH/NrfG|uniref:gas vesicle protein GvpG n=1 Tax=Sinomonas gamaensis TaxID=2565624 RepID=UPI00110933FB|nr:gas vesicle protein GvpG [Sinomonas gamaensis]
MGLFSAVFGLPLAPVRGVVWVAERLQEEAERQYYDPGLIRRQLEEVAQARAEGTLSDEDAGKLERELVARMLEGSRRQRREGY